ncbi:Jerky [Araneus ventricosus]|uniref:Jerky n=1 Tax=Araneus ventricosus TaxID=182803 RepID=A0A4Y2AAA2_ARAVE|nr:Jerky [Araneus ventricosus]
MQEKWLKFFADTKYIDEKSCLKKLSEYVFAIPAHNANVKRNEEVPISGIRIQPKALRFNSKFGGSKEFQASSCWLEKFKNRHGIRQLSIVGEKLSSDIEAGNIFIAELQGFIVKEKLTAEQIYNCDETGLYWRILSTKTLAAENEAVAQGRKKMKDRVTILGCANASGSHRVKLTLVRKSCGNCEEDEVSSWLDCDADDAGFRLMCDDEIIAQVRKSNSDEHNSGSDEDEVVKTSKISNSDAFECFAKGLMRLEQQTNSDSTELMLLKKLRDRAAKRCQSCLRQSKLPFKPM